MIPAIGLILLYGAIALNLLSIFALFQKKSKFFILSPMLTIASTLLLITTLILKDYQLIYTTLQISNDLPLLYRVAAIWGGQEGSLLFWCMILSILILFLRKKTANYPTLLFLAGSLLFFQLMVLYLSNPFTPLPPEMAIPTDGSGMNPQLRTLLMLLHPPLLYVGYIAFNISAAIAFGGLLSQTDHWIKQAQPFTLTGWIFLGAGNLSGMLWAYVELGWGGFWGWDPVENASLMPWLTATAFLYTINLYRNHKRYLSWCYTLIFTTFLLTIFGTFITRSGLINSIHAFIRSSIGYYFIAFILLLMVAITIASLKNRGKKLEKQKLKYPNYIDIGLIVILLLILAIVFTGTIFPSLLALSGKKVELSTQFFNHTLIPFYYVIMILLSGKVMTQLIKKEYNILPSLGLLILLIAVSGAKYQIGYPLHLALNKPIKVSETTTLKLIKNDLKPQRGFNLKQSTIDVKIDNTQFQVTPEKKIFHHKRGGDRTIVALKSTLLKDHYFRLREHTATGAMIDYYINPLMIWIWIGGALTLLGGIISFILGFRAQKTRA